jgi:CheY-like chemotaxis protein
MRARPKGKPSNNLREFPMALKLFVADDSITIQKIVGLAFSDQDVEIETVSSGDLALDSVRAFKPDIVLADVFMPGCSGYEVCAAIKEDPELAHTPVILLVGTFEPFDELEAARVKCDRYLMKPFDTSELIQAVRLLAGNKLAAQKDETPVEAPASQAPAPPVPMASEPYAQSPISPRVRESFLGSGRILELFDPQTLAAASAVSPGRMHATAVQTEGPPAPNVTPSEDFLNLVVDKVVRRMSSEVIREVAWEVVPELSEILIRRSLEDRNKS